MNVKYNQHSDEFKIEFGKRLRDLRTKRGFTIEEMINKLQIPRSTYASWELGKRIPLTKSLSAVAEILNTTTSYLMLENNDMNGIATDIKTMLENNELKKVWDGIELNEEQSATIASIINGYLKTQK